ncbi:C40 family peptidase [Synechococcus elongatus]|uniref:C40 family peptidase n=1 Tax=Synechococcus elongatus PCC 11802 TaxID=2283154 RepID=A0AAT9JZX4_SYNEL|nr:C40 family peptidase [Synechococcus elongatus]
MPALTHWHITADLDLFDSPACDRLATQAAAGRQLQILEQQDQAWLVRLAEDDYPGWIPISDRQHLQPASTVYQPSQHDRTAIEAAIPNAIAFAQAAAAQPNTYLWGGCLGPNYDCSGLVQAAFAAQGIWLPRDAWQQEQFCEPLPNWEAAEPGDLIFFGRPDRCTHVALYLGDRAYLHSSGREIGRNGIGIDWLDPSADAVSDRYWQQLRGAGRITRSYQSGSDRFSTWLPS